MCKNISGWKKRSFLLQSAHQEANTKNWPHSSKPPPRRFRIQRTQDILKLWRAGWVDQDTKDWGAGPTGLPRSNNGNQRVEGATGREKHSAARIIHPTNQSLSSKWKGTLTHLQTSKVSKSYPSMRPFRNVLFQNKSEPRRHGIQKTENPTQKRIHTTGMNPQNIHSASIRSQSPDRTYCRIPFPWNFTKTECVCRDGRWSLAAKRMCEGKNSSQGYNKPWADGNVFHLHCGCIWGFTSVNTHWLGDLKEACFILCQYKVGFSFFQGEKGNS